MARKPSPATASPAPDFEAALAELERIVEQMERGDQNLEDALASFQRGIELTRICQKGLKDAEQRVEKLIREGGGLRAAPLIDEDPDDTASTGD